MSFITFVNQSTNKQWIKNGIGVPTFGFGMISLAGLVIDGPFLYIDDSTTVRSVRDRVIHLFAQVSLVMSAAVSPIGVWMISKVVNQIFTTAQLDKMFGPNTIFEVNWKHPRHVVSLLAVGLAIPVLVKRLLTPPQNDGEEMIQEFAIYTVLTSRPVLHQGNLLMQRVFARTV